MFSFGLQNSYQKINKYYNILKKTVALVGFLYFIKKPFFIHKILVSKGMFKNSQGQYAQKIESVLLILKSYNAKKNYTKLYDTKLYKCWILYLKE